jgi:hypothetical protein
MNSALYGLAPGRLWSLWDMIEMEIGKLVYSLERLTTDKNNFERFQRDLTLAQGTKARVPLQDLRKIKGDVAEIERIASLAGND